MADSTEDIRINYLVDTDAAVAAQKKVDDALAETARIAKETAVKMAAEQQRAITATVKVTDAEKAYAAKIIGTNAALKLRAKALGITTAEVQKYDREMKAAIETEKRMAAQTVSLSGLSPRAALAKSKPVAVTSAAAGTGTGGASTGGIEGTTRSVQKLTDAQQQLRQVTRNLGYQVGDVVNTIAAGGNPMNALAVQALDVAFQFNLATVAAKAFALATGPVGLGVAAVVAATAVAANQIDAAREPLVRYQEVLDDTAASARSLARAQAALGGAQTSVANIIGELQFKAAKLRGELTDGDEAAGEYGNRIADELRPRLLAAGKAVAENQVRIQTLNEAIRSGALDAKEMAAAQLQLEEASKAQGGLNADLAEVKNLAAQGREAINEYAGELDRLGKEKDADTAASKAQREADGAAAAAKREAAAAARDAAAADRERVSEAKAVADATIAQGVATMKLVAQVQQLDETQEQRIAREFRETDQALRQQIGANEAAGISTAKLEEARISLREKTKARYQALIDEERKAQEDADKATEAAAKAHTRLIEDTYVDLGNQIGQIAAEFSGRFQDALGDTQGKIDEIGGLLKDLGANTVDASRLSGRALVEAYKDGKVAAKDLNSAQRQFIAANLRAEKAALAQKAEAQRKQALVAFAVQKGVAIAGAIVNTAQAVMTALAQLGPIAGGVAAGVVAAIGATQVGLIASEKPKFASGGFLNGRGAADGSIPMIGHEGEAVLSRQGRATMGDDTIRKANAGIPIESASGPLRLAMVYKHRVFDYFMRDHLRMDNTTTRRMRQGDRVGQVGRGRR